MAARVKQPRTFGESALRSGIAILFLAVFFSAAYWLWTHNADPVVVIPKPVLPKPNAFDYYVAAGNALVEPKKIDDAYQQYHRSLGSGSASPPMTQIAPLVNENKLAVNTLHQGFAYPYLSPPARSINDMFPYFAKERCLARLLVLQAYEQAQRGDLSGAVNRDLDAVQMGEEISHGSLLIGMLVGVACQAIGRHPVWAMKDHLSASQARAAARRLEQIQTRHVAFANTVQEEEWFGQAAMMEIFHNPSLLRGGIEGDATYNIIRLDIFRYGKRGMMDGYTRYMDQLISNARLPYAAKPPAPQMPKEIISNILAPELGGVRIKDLTNSQIGNGMLTVALALRAYKLEHGAYPVTLSQLVPAYLSQVPQDPFALAGPLKYRRTGTNYLLYSVGPDGKDGNGKPIFDASQKPPTTKGGYDPRSFVNENSQGDIVAGVNVY